MTRFLIFLFALTHLVTPANAQSDDRGILQAFLEDNLSDAGRDVRIEGFAGALSGRATLDQLTIADRDGVWLTLRGAVLDWNRASLLRGALDVEELSAAEIVLTRAPVPEPGLPAPEAQPFVLPDLPISVQIGRLAASRVTLGAALLGQEVVLALTGSAELADQSGRSDLRVTRIDGAAAQLDFAGSFSKASQDLALDLDLDEGPNGIAAELLSLPGRPSLRLRIAGTGPISDYTADIGLATDGVDRLTGRVTLAEDDRGQAFTADLGGDLRPLVTQNYRAFLGSDVRLNLAGTRFSDASLELDQARLSSQALTLDASLALSETGWPNRIDLDGVIEPVSGADVLLSLPGEPTRVSDARISLQYDVADGDRWDFGLTLTGLDRADLGLDMARITGAGTLSPELRRVAGRIDLDISGIAFADPDLSASIGPALLGGVRFDWQQGRPLALQDMALRGADYRLAGDATLSGITGQIDMALALDATLSADDLSRFAGVAGQPLAGRATLATTGTLAPVSGGFDLTLQGIANDLAIGHTMVDPLIAGQSTLDIVARRDETGLFLDRFNVRSEAADITADAVLGSEQSDIAGTAQLADLGLLVEGGSGPVTLGGTARHRGARWELDLNADALGGTRAALDGTATTVDGRVATVRGDVSLTTPNLGAYRDLIGQPVSGAIDVTGVWSGDVARDLYDLTLRGTLTNAGVGQDQVDRLLEGRVDLGLTARRAAGELVLDDLSIRSGSIEMTGSARLGQVGVDLSGQAVLADLGRLVDGASGPLAVVGTAAQRDEAWRIGATADAMSGSVATFDGLATTDGTGSTRLDGDVTLNMPDLAAYGDLVGQALSGSLAIGGTLSGNLTAQTVTGAFTGTGDELRLGQDIVDRLLRGRSRFALALAAAGTDISVDRFTLNSDAVDVSATARLTATERNISGTARLLDLGDVLDGAAGPLTATGSLIGQGEAWQLKAEARAPGDTELRITATAALSDGQIGAVTGDATLNAGRLSAYRGLVGQPLSGALSLTGGGSGDLSLGTFDVSLFGTGQNLGTGIRDADQLLIGTTRLSAEVRRDATGQLLFDAVEIATPQAAADLSGAYSDAQSRLRFDLLVRNLGLFVPALTGAVSAEGTLRAEGGPFRISTAITGPGGSRAVLDGTVSRDASSAALQMTGQAPLAIANRLASPNLLNGIATFDLRLDGPLAMRALSGRLETSGARITLPNLRLAVSGLDASAQLRAGTAEIFGLGTVSSGGQVRTSGQIGLTSPFAANLRTEIIALTLTEPGLYDTRIDGRLDLSGPLRSGASIGGTLTIGETEIRIPDRVGGGSGVIAGLVHLNEPAAVRATRARAGLTDRDTSRETSGVYPLDVTVNAPARIFIRGRGLDAELGGSVALRGTTADIITDGRFDLIRGRLEILGKRLTLTEAFAELRGDLEPYIRAVATTNADDATVRIELEGPASGPDLTLTSTPDLPEDEILARLLFGRDLTEISALQALQMANAVRVLAGGADDGIVGRLRQNFGLDDLDIATDEDGETGLRVGRYINDNLYTDVTVGTSGTSEINLNLTLSPSVTVRGSAGSDGDTGIGIFFERDY